MLVHLAGWQASTEARESRLIKAGAIKARCISFANVVKIPGFPYYVKGIDLGYQTCVKYKIPIMMDSGVFSYRRYGERLRAKNDKKALAQFPSEKEFIRLYVEFCKANASKWSFYVTTDITVVGADNWKRHEYLEKLGLRPTPVYHGDGSSDLDYLRRYADKGYKKICIGSSPILRTSDKQKRHYFDATFNQLIKLGMVAHGLGFTTPWMMAEYPWDTVDSSSWSRAAGYGSIMRFSEETMRLETIHVSDVISSAGQLHAVSDVAMKRLRKEVEAEGYDWHELQTDHTARHLCNARTMNKLGEWASRQQTRTWRSWL